MRLQKRQRIVVAFCLMAAATGLSLYVFYETNMREAHTSSLIGKQAPDIEGTLLDGRQFKLADFRGKKTVVIDEWAVFCPPCRESLPLAASISEKYKDKDVVFFSLNNGESSERIKSFLDSKNLHVPVILDPAPECKICRSLQGNYLPQVFVIDKNGKVAYAHIGYENELVYRLKLEAAINGAIGP